MRLIAVIADPAPVRRILDHLGLSATPARAGPRRAFALGLLEALETAVASDFDGLDPPSPLD